MITLYHKFVFILWNQKLQKSNRNRQDRCELLSHYQQSRQPPGQDNALPLHLHPHHPRTLHHLHHRPGLSALLFSLQIRRNISLFSPPSSRTCPHPHLQLLHQLGLCWYTQEWVSLHPRQIWPRLLLHHPHSPPHHGNTGGHKSGSQEDIQKLCPVCRADKRR